MAKRKTNEEDGPANINPIYEHVTGGDYDVDYGPMRGGHDRYVRVLNTEGPWLYVQPITERGENSGERYWLSASIVTALRPLNLK